MDNEALKLIARLKISAARAGQPIDVVRFAADRAYAKGALQKFADSVDEDAVLLALQVMDKLGFVAPTPRPEAVVLPMPGRTERPQADPDSRYIGRLR